MNFIRKYLERRAENKKVRAREKEIIKICLTIRSYVFKNLKSPTNVIKYRYVGGLTTYQFSIANRQYRIDLDEMIRGDLFKLTDTKTGAVLVEFGDQSRAYSFLGLSSDPLVMTSFTYDQLEAILSDGPDDLKT